MLELEVCVTIDEAGHEIGVGEVQRLRAGGRGDLGMRTDAGDAAGPIDKNGAILDGWRRNGVDASGADSKQCLSYGDTPTPNGECTWQTCVGSVLG